MAHRVSRVIVQVFLSVFLVIALVQSPSAQASVSAAAPNIAYVFYGNDVDANAFKGLLASSAPAYSVDLIPLASVLATDFSLYDMTIIADDTGSLNTWGTPADWAAQVAKIKLPNKPILGIGEGGYAFFGKLGQFIGWPQGWHGPQTSALNAGTPPAGTIFGGLLSPATLYSAPVNSVGIYLNKVPADAFPIGLEPATQDHADQIMQGCHFLWGNSGSPSLMTGDGKTLFLNYVQYAVTFQCPPPPAEQPPDQVCLNVIKTSDAQGAVMPGQVITYTLSYVFDATCLGGQKSGQLVDKVPVDTVFVPGSATDGIAPSPGGDLEWTVFAVTGTQIKQFQVVVSDNVCAHQRVVNNQATLHVTGYTQVVSNLTSNPVNCPPVSLPNSSTFYAEDEVEVHPYPLMVGLPSQVSVRLNNISAAPRSVTVQFQSAPVLGIGLVYSTFDTKTVTLPALGSALVKGMYLPTFSGQASFQVLISGDPPLFTQSNLDVSEDFKPGVKDSLVVPVRNNLLAMFTLSLVIDNTCPGWTATVNPATLTDMLPGETRNVTFEVTPPVGPSLGSGCHIDLQAWANSTLIGGIRKLDVPPVHLPLHVNPPWEEPEIVPIPNPPVAGAPGKVCIDLTNPLSVPKDVTVEFSEADFGAGMGFTPIASTPITLPPNSAGRYCVNWTPTGTGTLHRCILVTLKQAGFLDMHSQRNLDLVRQVLPSLNLFDFPFKIGNPDGIPHKLTFQINSVGIDPFWKPVLIPNPGDPPPDGLILQAGQMISAHLGFSPAMTGAASPNAAPSTWWFGSASQVEVAVLLDGRQVSGFTVQLQNPTIYLPSIRK